MNLDSEGGKYEQKYSQISWHCCYARGSVGLVRGRTRHVASKLLVLFFWFFDDRDCSLFYSFQLGFNPEFPWCNFAHRYRKPF